MKLEPGVSSAPSVTVKETSEQLEFHSFATFSRIVFQQTRVSTGRAKIKMFESKVTSRTVEPKMT